MKFNVSDKTIFAWHSWLGLLVGIFTLFLSITGTMLLFSDEIDAALAPEMVKVQPTSQRFPLDSMLATLRRTFPLAVLNEIDLYTARPDRAVITKITLDGQQQWVYWNPHTNQLNGLRKKDDILMQNVLEWHEELTAGDLGHLFLFLVGLALLGSVLSGLWYYRKSLLKVFKAGVRSKNTYLFNADLHKLLGVVSCVFLLLMAGTGTFFHWEKIERMLGETPEEGALLEKDFISKPLTETNQVADKWVALSTKSITGFVPEVIDFQNNAHTISISGTRPTSMRLLGKFNSAIVFDATSDKVLNIQHLEEADLELKAEKSFEQLHFGQYAGIWSKLIYAIGGFCLFTISITGFVVWLKKK